MCAAAVFHSNCHRETHPLDAITASVAVLAVVVAASSNNPCEPTTVLLQRRRRVAALTHIADLLFQCIESSRQALCVFVLLHEIGFQCLSLVLQLDDQHKFSATAHSTRVSELTDSSIASSSLFFSSLSSTDTDLI
jgi:hypothetical protein